MYWMLSRSATQAQHGALGFLAIIQNIRFAFVRAVQERRRRSGGMAQNALFCKPGVAALP